MRIFDKLIGINTDSTFIHLLGATEILFISFVIYKLRNEKNKFSHNITLILRKQLNME